jgi:hypothetical protein
MKLLEGALRRRCRPVLMRRRREGRPHGHRHRFDPAATRFTQRLIALRDARFLEPGVPPRLKQRREAAARLGPGPRPLRSPVIAALPRGPPSRAIRARVPRTPATLTLVVARGA